ncbi:hypothetical protein E3N88_36721 [Mikania micrantha]|uniref:Uncharacterized protein n=1 Tax=Mikania micrantha TaxID=192012 RepID=A0A5N6M522_9ASTR|nr:hypothetical protein E3N88_36721 [Mikania micrantha]
MLWWNLIYSPFSLVIPHEFLPTSAGVLSFGQGFFYQSLTDVRLCLLSPAAYYAASLIRHGKFFPFCAYFPLSMDRRGLESSSSLLTQEELQGFCRLYQLPMSVHPRLPRPDDDVSLCNDTVVVFTQWFTFEKRRPQNFSSCTSKILRSLRDWKLRFFYVSNNFLPARLPRRNIRNLIVDDAPPLRDCDVPLFRMLVENPTPAVVFPEPLLVMAGVSPLWDEPSFRPAVFEEGEEMNLLKILKKANRGMEFVAVESTVPVPSPPAMSVALDSPAESIEIVSSPDDDEMPLASLLEKRGQSLRKETQSQGVPLNPPLKLRLRGAASSSSEMVMVSAPMVGKRKEACSPSAVGVEDCEVDKSLSLRQKKGKMTVEDCTIPVSGTPLSGCPEDVCMGSGSDFSLVGLDMPISAVFSDSVSVTTVSTVLSSIVSSLPPVTTTSIVSPLVAETCHEDMDTLALARLFSVSLETHRNQGLEIVRRLQHRSDVSMKFQRRIAVVEDELVKALEEKKHLLGELLDMDALRGESKDLKESLRLANEKVAIFEPRIVELESEVGHNRVEMQEQRVYIKNYKTDMRLMEGLVKDLKQALEVKQGGLEQAQEDVLTARVEIARLSEENQRLRNEVVETTSLNDRLAADRAWLVTQGFRRVFNRIRDSREYVQLLGDVNSACLAVGYQNGLRAGYKYSTQGLLLEESPCYDPTTEAWMTKATLALGAADHSLLSLLEDSPNIPVVELEALTAVIDPTTPLP